MTIHAVPASRRASDFVQVRPGGRALDRRLALGEVPEQGSSAPRALAGGPLPQWATGTPDPIERPGAEPSGVIRTRTAGGPRTTSPDGGSPETERAIAAAPAEASPGRTAYPSRSVRPVPLRVRALLVPDF